MPALARMFQVFDGLFPYGDKYQCNYQAENLCLRFKGKYNIQATFYEEALSLDRLWAYP